MLILRMMLNMKLEEKIKQLKKTLKLIQKNKTSPTTLMLKLLIQMKKVKSVMNNKKKR
jgi:hypothetical protein